MSQPPPNQFILCPYCGHIQTRIDRCDNCAGLFEPLSRMATQIAMGPWFVRDKANPFRPGCSYETLQRLIETGKVKQISVLRGPTTKQFWSLARNVPGVSHLLGLCYGCQGKVKTTDSKCPHCSADFEVAHNRNTVGLMYATESDVVAAQKKLDRLVAISTGKATAAPEEKADVEKAKKEAAPEQLPGADLLKDVIGSDVAATVISEASKLPDPNALEDAGTATSLEPSAGVPSPAMDFSQPAAALDPALGRTVPTQPSRGSKLGLIIAALVILNIVVLGAVGAGIMVVLNNRDKQQQNQNPAPAASIPTTPPKTSRVPNATPPPGIFDAAPVIDEQPQPTPDTTPTAAENPDPRPVVTTPPPEAPLTVAQALRAAAKLEQTAQYAEALAILQEVSNRTPVSKRPPELGQAIRRLEGLVARENTTRFFEE